MSGLDDWRKRVGDEEADGILRQAGIRGTAIHDMAEKYLLKQDWKAGHMPVNRMTFNNIIPLLDRISRLQCLEVRLMSHIVKVAGTVDCIACFDDEPAVIDFKTSRRVVKHDDIHDYFKQASVYSLMFEELTGVVIKKLVIVMACDDHPYSLLFVEDRKKWLEQFIKQRMELPDWGDL